MSNTDRFSYTIQESDIGVAQVADRYDTTVRAIWAATAMEAGRFRNVKQEEFLSTVRFGDVLVVPYAGDPWEWRVIALKARTLKEYCDRKPEPARTGGPPLTPQFLWFHLANESIRNIILHREPDLEARRRLDRDPGAIPLEPGDEFFVPYPVRDRAPVVKATRSTNATPSVIVETAPEWITALRVLDEQVSSLADRLAQLNEKCDSLARQGQTVCLRLIKLTEMVTFAVNYQPPSGALLGLQNAMAMLTGRATELLFANPADKLGMQEDATRQTLAKKLNTMVHGSDLRRCTLSAALAPKERVGGDSVIQISDRIFARAYEALATSHQADEAFRDIDAAYKLLPDSQAAKPEASQSSDAVTALSAYVGLTNATLGNLPGPSSLGVALVGLWIRIKMPSLLKASKELAEKQLAAAQHANQSMANLFTGKTTTDEFVAAASEAGTLRAMSPKFLQQLIRYGKLTDTEIEKLSAAVRSPEDAAGLRAAAEMIAGKTHSSIRWHGVMAALNFIALGLAVDSVRRKDGFSPVEDLNVAGAAGGALAGAIQLCLSMFSDIRFRQPFEKVAKGFGTVGLVTAIGTGVITALDSTQSTASKTSAYFQIVGAAASLAAMSQQVPALQLACALEAIPFLQFAGAAVMIASTAISLWPVIQALMVPGPKKVLLAQLEDLKAQPIWQQMIAAHPDLDAPLQSVLKQINASDDGGLFDFDFTSKNADALRALGFVHEDIICMTARHPLPDYSYAEPY